MVTIERVRRPFWMHQLVEYILGFALIMTSIQQPEPRIPALMGLVILLNAAIVAGPAGAFKLVPRWLHRYLDLGVIALLLLMAVQPWWEVDPTGKLIMAMIAVVMFFIWFHSDFSRAGRPQGGEGQEGRGKGAASTDGQHLRRQDGRPCRRPRCQLAEALEGFARLRGPACRRCVG